MTEKITKTKLEDLEAQIEMQAERIKEMRQKEIEGKRYNPRLFREITVLRELFETYQKLRVLEKPKDKEAIPPSSIFDSNRIASFIVALSQRQRPTKLKGSDARIHDGNGASGT